MELRLEEAVVVSYTSMYGHRYASLGKSSTILLEEALSISARTRIPFSFVEALVNFGKTQVPMSCKVCPTEVVREIRLQSFIKVYMSHIPNLRVWVS